MNLNLSKQMLSALMNGDEVGWFKGRHRCTDHKMLAFQSQGFRCGSFIFKVLIFAELLQHNLSRISVGFIFPPMEFEIRISQVVLARYLCDVLFAGPRKK